MRTIITIVTLVFTMSLSAQNQEEILNNQLDSLIMLGATDIELDSFLLNSITYDKLIKKLKRDYRTFEMPFVAASSGAPKKSYNTYTVSGHRKSNGTYVKAYQRTFRDGDKTNNLSYKNN